MANDFQPRVGHEFTLTPALPEWGGRVLCRVTEPVPPHRLAYTWRGTDPATLDTLVTFQLYSVPGGPRLTPDPQRFHRSQPLAPRPGPLRDHTGNSAGQPPGRVRVQQASVGSGLHSEDKIIRKRDTRKGHNLTDTGQPPLQARITKGAPWPRPASSTAAEPIGS
jgi:hypothetical protein